jgi:trehalose 6-phosphate phosphatase
MQADAPAHAAQALRLARRVLGAEPAGVVSDIDGTLAPIVRDPTTVRLADGGAQALEALAERLPVVALVTGRAAADARRIAGVEAVLIAGNHGVEWLEPGADLPPTTPDADRAARRLDGMLEAVPVGEPGVWIEHKGLSATVHFRNAPDPVAARAQVVEALERRMTPDMQLRHGRMSVELRPVGLGDKGQAVHRIVERFGLRGLLALGDDVTDLDMFQAAADLRAAGTLDAAIIAVAAGREAPPAVAAAADVVIPGPAAAVELLAALAAD